MEKKPVGSLALDPEPAPLSGRPWVRWPLALAALVVLAAVAVAHVFVWPATSPFTKADAVVVLSGDHGERLPRALELLQRGFTTRLVLVGPLDTPAATQLCLGGAAFEVVCLSSEKDSTRIEAEVTSSLAASRGWKSLIVVTSTQHVARAGLLFARCFDGKLTMVAARPAFRLQTTLGQYIHEALGLGEALVLQRSC